MRMQLIFVVETNKDVQSDWIYIKETLENLYRIERSVIKLSPVYMNGRGNYSKKLNEIKSLEKKFKAMSDESRSHVIYCFDCDAYDTNSNDRKFLEDARLFCKKNDFEFVWFCKDIEQVYLGRSVGGKVKRKEADRFKAKHIIDKINVDSLNAEVIGEGRSNLMLVLNKYGIPKKIVMDRDYSNCKELDERLKI